MKNLKLLRKLKGASQKDVADYLGMIQSGYQRYETGTREPPVDILKRLADYFGVSVSDLVSDSANPQWLSFDQPAPDFVSITTVKIPVIGHVRAGYDALAEQAVEAYLEVEPAVKQRWPDAAALKVYGDSMLPELRDGDWVIISQRADDAPASAKRSALASFIHSIVIDRAGNVVVNYIPPGYSCNPAAPRPKNKKAEDGSVVSHPRSILPAPPGVGRFGLQFRGVFLRTRKLRTRRR